MTAAATGSQPAITAKPGANPAPTSTSTSSPARRKKELPNPQQGMADGANAVGGGATSNNTACTSPLTVTSLEVAAAATAAAGVPQVVSQVVPSRSQPPQSKPASTVESILGKLSLNHPVQQQQPPPVPHRPMEDKKMRLRTPPSERDSRKLFVGGLPTDVSDREFLEFFQQYGEVIDSVVIIDRMTKRSRGFGFVTFATETCANSLLTVIPGKTGYVHINGKQCEVKASTPKADDGSYKPRHNNHHGAPGMWRSNPPRHDGNRGYVARQPMSNAARVAAAAQMKQQAMMQQQQQPRGGKNFTIDNDFNGDVDGQNFDQLHQPSLQATPGYPNMYSRGLPATNLPLYQYNNSYQNSYASGALGSYGYPNVSSGASASSMSSYADSSYPAAGPGHSYVPYGPGSYDPYAAVPYPGGYGGVGSDGSSPAFAGQPTGYGNYGGYNVEGGGPSQGCDDNNGPQPYSRSYPDGGNDHADAAEQYE